MMNLSAFFLSSAIALSAAVPAGAFPVGNPVAGVSAVQQIDHRDGYRNQYYNRDYYRRSYDRRGYYNGYHGSRYYRDGYYRHNDGWWYPMAAFGTGVIIGGAIASQPPVVVDGGINPRHVEWCLNRYRTYRPYDNTYAPRAGVRAQCYSPYY